LFAETDDVADPLLHILAECVERVERHGVVVDWQNQGSWTGPGAAADVVVLDLLLSENGLPVFGELRQLVDAGRRVVVYTGNTDRGTALRCIGLGGACLRD
jgi:hypothetical protein